MTARVDATAYLAPYRRRRVRRPVLLRQTEHTYPQEPSPEQSWLPIAFRAFARIAQSTPVRDLLIVGTGNGLDALGAAEIFDLRSLTATDLGEEGLAVARENIRGGLVDDSGLELSFAAGDLLAPVAAGLRVDLVYENLPNIPASQEVELSLGTISGRFFDVTGIDVPSPYGDYLLALHYRCLRDAWEHVREGGGVLTAIGGRMPDAIAFGMHRACGYEPELAAFDLKVQVEPGLVLPGYRRAEEETGVEFRYYAEKALGLVAGARREGLDGQELLDAVEDELDPLVMTAREAEVRSRRGEPVAHTVLMIVGRRPAAN